MSNFDKGRFPYFRYFKKLDLQFQKSAPTSRSFQLNKSRIIDYAFNVKNQLYSIKEIIFYVPK